MAGNMAGIKLENVTLPSKTLANDIDYLQRIMRLFLTCKISEIIIGKYVIKRPNEKSLPSVYTLEREETDLTVQAALREILSDVDWRKSPQSLNKILNNLVKLDSKLQGKSIPLKALLHIATSANDSNAAFVTIKNIDQINLVGDVNQAWKDFASSQFLKPLAADRLRRALAALGEIPTFNSSLAKVKDIYDWAKQALTQFDEVEAARQGAGGVPAKASEKKEAPADKDAPSTKKYDRYVIILQNGTTIFNAGSVRIEDVTDDGKFKVGNEEIDLNNGIQLAEARVLGFTEEAYNFFSSGGKVGSAGDESMTEADIEAAFNAHINNVTSGLGSETKAAVIAAYVKAKGYVLIPAKGAAEKLLGGELKLNAASLIGNVCAGSLDAAKKVISNILGKRYADNLELDAAQLETFLATMGFLAQNTNIGGYTVDTTALADKPVGILGGVTNFLAWLSGGEIKEEAEKPEGTEPTKGRKSARATLTDNEMKKLQKLEQSGSKMDLINELKRLRALGRYQGNLWLADFLASKLFEMDNFEEALNPASFAYDQEATPGRKELLIKCINNHLLELQKKAPLNPAGRASAKKTHQTLTKLLEDTRISEYKDKYATLALFKKAIVDKEVDDKLLMGLVVMANNSQTLAEEPLPGQLEFEQAVSKSDLSPSDVKAAYEAFAQKLEAAKTAELAKTTPDNHKLANIYIQLIEIEQLRVNIDKVAEYSLAALTLYQELSPEDEMRDKILGSAEGTIKQFYSSKNINNGKREKVRLELAKKLFIKYKEIKPDGEIEVEKNVGLNIELLDEEIKEAGPILNDTDLAQINTYRLGYAADKPSNDSNYLSPAIKMQAAVKTLYILDKHKEDHSFYGNMETWAKRTAAKMNKNNPLNPINKFKNYDTSAKFIELLAKSNG